MVLDQMSAYGFGGAYMFDQMLWVGLMFDQMSAYGWGLGGA